MLITCPSCASAYELDAGRIGPGGRTVRCAGCRESWFIAPLDDDAGQTAPPDPEGVTVLTESGFDDATFQPIATAADGSVSETPAPIVIEPDRPAAPKRPRGKKAARRRGRSSDRAPARSRLAIAAAVLVCATLPAAILFRSSVVTAFPGTATLFRTVGLPVNLVGLSFGEVRSTLSHAGGAPVLEVSGEITNVGRTGLAVPMLTMAVQGEVGEALYTWSARPEAAEVAAGATVPFRARLSAPPPAARRVEVTFRDGRGREAVALR